MGWEKRIFWQQGKTSKETLQSETWNLEERKGEEEKEGIREEEEKESEREEDKRKKNKGGVTRSKSKERMLREIPHEVIRQ